MDGMGKFASERDTVRRGEIAEGCGGKQVMGEERVGGWTRGSKL